MVSDQPLEDAHKAETHWEIIGLINLPQELYKLAPTGQVQRHKLQNCKHKIKKKEVSVIHKSMCGFIYLLLSVV